jgi:mercuric ion transport protein
MQTAYLLPLTVLALAMAVAALGFRASRRRGYGPFVVGLAAAVGLVVGKFVVDSNAAVYVSVAALVGASLWNSWPKKSVPAAPTEPLLQLGSIKKEN